MQTVHLPNNVVEFVTSGKPSEFYVNIGSEKEKIYRPFMDVIEEELNS